MPGEGPVTGPPGVDAVQLQGAADDARRWCGLHRGLPRISRNLLAQRLASMERAGLVERRPGRQGFEYHLTQAGQELRPVIDALGTWGSRWAATRLCPEHLDPGLLLWFLRRRIRTDHLPPRRVIVQFQFRRPAPPRSFWLLLDGLQRQADVCLTDPGVASDLYVDADLEALVRVFLGQLPLAAALREQAVLVTGPASLGRAFPSWIGLSPFAAAATT